MNLNSIIDLSDVKSIYENSDLVVIGTIEEKEYFIPDKQDYVVTHGKLEIERIIKGYNSGGMIDFYMTGGFCIVEEYQNKVGVEQPVNIEKLGITKLSDNDKKNQYMVFNYKYGKDFKEVKKYILMLEKSDNGYFSISNYGFIDDQYNIQIKKLILY